VRDAVWKWSVAGPARDVAAASGTSALRAPPSYAAARYRTRRLWVAVSSNAPLRDEAAEGDRQRHERFEASKRWVRGTGAPSRPLTPGRCERYLGLVTDPPAIDEALCRLLEYDGPERREQLYEALLGGSLLVVVGEDASDESGGERDPGPAFALLEGEDGRVRIPAFTAAHRAGDFLRPGMTVARIPAVDLFELAVANRVAAVVLNPGEEATLRLLSGELAALADRKLPDVGQMGILRSIESSAPGDVANPPRAFVRHVTKTLDAQPLVCRAYLFSMTPSGGEPAVFLGVQLDERAEGRDFQMVLQQLGDRIISPPELGNVELVVLEADLLERVRLAHRPVFERVERH